MPLLLKIFRTPSLRRLGCFLLVCQLSLSAAAQTFGVALSYMSTLEPSFTLTDLEIGKSKVDLRLAGGVAGPLEFSVSARETTSFGPVGNLMVRSSAKVDSTGRFDFGLGAQGVIATVAAQAQLSLFTAEVGRFEISEAYQEESRPFLLTAPLDFGAALDLSASYRVSRRFIVNAAPSLYVTNLAGLGGRVALEGRFVKLVGPDDVRARALAYLSPAGEAFGALGVEYSLNRRNLPSGHLALWAGLNGDGISPGASLQISQTLKSLNSSYSLFLAAEPYRLDLLPYRAAATYSQNVGPGALEAFLYGTLSPRLDVPALSFRVGYSLPF